MKTINGIKLYNVKDLASLLEVTPQTIYKLIKNDKLKHIRISNSYLVSEDNLISFLNGDE